ncbi:MAG: aspartyl protease [Deltaproteobacteria bacterium]|nr:MAG: aspartyl protease [Deltaproteobacteria bacterium]
MSGDYSDRMLLPRWPVGRRVPTMRGMGMTYLSAKLTRPDGRGPGVRLRFVVDSGALYSVLPERAWKRLGLRPTRSAEFTLADGTVIERRVSRCTFAIAGVAETSPAVLGEAKDVAILGVVTLETLGLMLNPLTREVLPMKLMLATSAPWAAVP